MTTTAKAVSDCPAGSRCQACNGRGWGLFNNIPGELNYSGQCYVCKDKGTT